MDPGAAGSEHLVEDEYVDLSLTSVVRALITQDIGELTSKDEAIAQLEARGVPARLAEGVRQRRGGHHAATGLVQGVQTRRVVKRLLNQR